MDSRFESYKDDLQKVNKYHNLSYFYNGEEYEINNFDRSDVDDMFSNRELEVNISGGYKSKPSMFDDMRDATKNDDSKKEKGIMGKSTDKVIDATKSALNDTKKTIFKMKKGKAVLTALKSTLKSTPGVPDTVKALIDTPGYGDLVVGLLLNVVSSTVTSSEAIKSAAKNANFVGAVEFSNTFTLIEDLIEGAITKSVGAIENKMNPTAKDPDPTME